MSDSGTASSGNRPDENTPDTAVAALLATVGERVLAARKARRETRRALSERSGVSQRYLAQLEAGEGNISIGLLLRIAIALELPIDALVGTGESEAGETGRLIARFRNADAVTRARVLRALDPERLRERKAERVCLIGLRGAGKSTLGARLAESLGVPFIELSREVERAAGMPIGEIIALYSEAGYRRLEADALKAVIDAHERVVLAVAGGLVEERGTFVDVLEHFHTVWLTADPEAHMARVRAQGDLRPMAGDPRAMARLREILAARESRYRQADHRLDTGGRTVETSLHELQHLVRGQGLVAGDADIDADIDQGAPRAGGAAR